MTDLPDRLTEQVAVYLERFAELYGGDEETAVDFILMHLDRAYEAHRLLRQKRMIVPVTALVN